MSYAHPHKDSDFVLRHLVGFDDLCANAELDEINMDLAAAVLEEAGKFGTDILAPLNRPGDLQGVTVNDGNVQEAEGFKEAYQQFAEGGWLSLTADEAFGGQNLPNVLSTAVNEIWNSANLSFALCPLLSQGAMESMTHHGDEYLQSTFLPKMVSGEWPGTMNLTEPDAGSDLAAVKTSAEFAGDHYLISGQKIFITWGDHQMTENIVHLVLARLPDAPPGVKGISLFIVPKFMVNADGSIGERNSLKCLSVEHKLGIHGSPTCVMEYALAKGYLVGEANKGLSYMFTMMNHARQAVGLQGLAISERAYQQAVSYARERVQGTRRDGSRIPIIQHPDVRRMLMMIRSGTEAMRAVALEASAEIDRANYASDAEQKTQHSNRVELWTPIVKGWLTELAQELTSLNVQIHGGMGFIEETGAAQHYRDARILPIYEGTTGIQALDFIGRKTLMNQGTHLASLLEDMQQTANELAAAEYPHASVVQQFNLALQAGQQARDWLLEQSGSDGDLAGSVCVDFLMLFGYLSGGWMMVRSGMQAAQLLSEDQDTDFLNTKLQTVRFFCEHLLPRVHSHFAGVIAGSESIMALTEEQF